MDQPRNHLFVLVFSTSVLILIVIFVWLQLLIPSDSASVEKWELDAVVVDPFEEKPGGLQSGDMVTAIEGYGMESWAQSLFTSREALPQLDAADGITYSVMRNGESLNLDITLTQTSFINIAKLNWSGMLFGFVFFIIATFVLVKSSSIPASRALFLLATSILFSTLNSKPGLYSSDLIIRSGFWSFHLMNLFGFMLIFPSFLYFGMVFPQPLPIIKRYRWLVPMIFITPFVIRILYLSATWFSTPNTLEWLGGWWYGEQSIVAPIFLILTLIAIIWSYRKNADPVSRQKVRWVVFAFLAMLGFSLVVAVFPDLIFGRPLIRFEVLAFPALVLPISIGIAILRYRLFDIDLIIRRTLQYTLLTGLLVLVYFGSVVVLQSLVENLTGTQSPFVIVISTLAIAALFNPLRTRTQDFIDRRFYRRKYDAERALAQFAADARDEVDMADLTRALISVVEETLQPEQLSLWLVPQRDRRQA